MSPYLLKNIRKKLNLTQKEAAKIIDVSCTTWQQWETGKASMHTAFFELFKKRTNLDNQINIFEDIISMNTNLSPYSKFSQKDITNNSEELARITHKNEQDNNKSNKLSFIDLFAGVGGIRQSFESINGKCVFSSEIDQFAKYTYYSNFGVVPYGDITKIPEQDIPQHDLLCAGFPCQPFSHIGKREGFNHPTQGTMFHEILRIIQYNKTPIIFLENVPGLINHDNGNTLGVIIETLKEAGYNIFHTVLNAADFGVPQNRKRFYLVGFLNHAISFNFPKPPMIQSHIGDILEENIEGYSISKHLQKSYLFKVDDGRPNLIDKNTQGSIKTLVSTYHKIQRLTGTFVKDGETGIRLLTANECKAIMGFPSNFVIPVSRTQMYRQMGNSVAVPVVTAIAKEIKRALDEAQQI